MSEMDAAWRLETFANHWQSAMDDDLVSDVIAVIDAMALRKGDLRAALDELERLRAEQALLARRLRHAYRSGFDDRHYSALAALGLASSNRQLLAKQHATKVLAEIAEADSAPQQPESGSDADGAE